MPLRALTAFFQTPPVLRLTQLWTIEAGGDNILHATRQLLLVLTSIVTAVIAAAWVMLTSSTVIGGRPFVAALCALAPFVFLPFPILALRPGADLDRLAHVFVALLYGVVTATVAALGGPVSTTLYFLVLLPMLAALLLGVRIGLMWAAIVALTVLVLHVARPMLPPSTYALWPGATGD